MGAILKKLALMLGSDPKTAKKLGIAALSLVVAIFLLPVLLLVSILGGIFGTGTTQTEEVGDTIVSDRQRVLVQVTAEMRSAGFGNRLPEAKVLCLYMLLDKLSEPDFVQRLVGCFTDGQTDEELLDAVNAAFGTDLPMDMFTSLLAVLRSEEIDTFYYYDPATKNNLDLVQWAIAAERANWGYVMGTFGNILTESGLNAKLEQYPSAITPYEAFIRENWLGRRTADCVGLIKGYCWFDPASGNIQYKTNGMPDINESTMFLTATEKGTIDTIPEIPGLAVWMTGHIGIYIGHGEVIQAAGTRLGVIRTRLEDGNWTHWLKVPFITYLDMDEQPTEPTEPSTEPTAPPTEPTVPVTEPPAPPDPPPAPKPTDPQPTEPTPTQPPTPQPTEPKPTEPPKPTLPAFPSIPIGSVIIETTPFEPIDPIAP